MAFKYYFLNASMSQIIHIIKPFAYLKNYSQSKHTQTLWPDRGPCHSAGQAQLHSPVSHCSIPKTWIIRLTYNLHTKQQSRHLSSVVWTTATPCCMACQTAFCGRFSPFRTPLHVWSQELNDVTTSCQCCISCIDCLSVNESSTRLHAWYTSCWLVRHPHT